MYSLLGRYPSIGLLISAITRTSIKSYGYTMNILNLCYIVKINRYRLVEHDLRMIRKLTGLWDMGTRQAGEHGGEGLYVARCHRIRILRDEKQCYFQTARYSEKPLN